MKNVILSIEDHDIFVPEGYQLIDSATYLVLVFAWAYENNFLSSSFSQNEDCKRQFNNMITKQIAIIEFVTDILHGALNEEDFIPSLREFVSDYIETGIFYKDVCSFFEINHIYELSKNWEEISLFIQEINAHYLDVKDNY